MIDFLTPAADVAFADPLAEFPGLRHARSTSDEERERARQIAQSNIAFRPQSVDAALGLPYGTVAARGAMQLTNGQIIAEARELGKDPFQHAIDLGVSNPGEVRQAEQWRPGSVIGGDLWDAPTSISDYLSDVFRFWSGSFASGDPDRGFDASRTFGQFGNALLWAVVLVFVFRLLK